MTPLDEILHTAREAARAGASVILKAGRSSARVPFEAKARHDYVTAVDREAEAAIVGTIRAKYPDHAVMAEESERVLPGEGFMWIIDPLDGTTNFIHGFPVFSVSIAAATLGEGEGGGNGSRMDPSDLAVGVVLDPLREEIFTALKGGGARLNDAPIRVSDARELDECLLATGFPFRARELLPAYLKIFAELHGATQGIRRTGSAALDLAYVAAGRVDGFFEFGLSPWDMAAGTLLITEAGGAVKGFLGGSEFLESGHILAGTPQVAERILEAVARHYPSST